MYNHELYTVGIICALDLEAKAVIAMLDAKHDDVSPIDNDPNYYTFGKIGEHMVVIVCLPGGATGTVSAAIVANDMMKSFKIRHGLMVGIGGGVPGDTDIRLGDVVVSQPTGIYGGVVQYDFGKIEAGGVLRRTGMLNRPPRALLSAMQALKFRLEGIDLNKHIQDMLSRLPKLKKEGFVHQGQDNDVLFAAFSNHVNGMNCQNCDRMCRIDRIARDSDEPEIHYGNIASGNRVVKDGIERDRIAEQESVICFEMEAAGLMNDFPCLVIRGICDYADSHKQKRWQRYAAATAAAYAKELLLTMQAVPSENTPSTTAMAGRPDEH